MGNVATKWSQFHWPRQFSKSWMPAALIAVGVLAAVLLIWWIAGEGGWLESVVFEE